MAKKYFKHHQIYCHTFKSSNSSCVNLSIIQCPKIQWNKKVLSPNNSSIHWATFYRCEGYSCMIR